MAVQTPVLPVVNPAGAPTFNAVGSPDTIPVVPGGKYLLVVKNASGTIDNIVITDQVSGVGPAGSSTPLVANVAVSVPITTGERHVLLDANRFRDSNGNINLTHSQTASVTCLVYGPF